MDNMIFTSEVCGVVLIAPFDKISRPPCSTIRFIVFLSLFFRCFSPFSFYHRTFSLTTEKEQQQDMETYLSEYTTQKNMDIRYQSVDKLGASVQTMKNAVLLIGGLIGGIFALVGIINLMNLIMTSIVTRRHEFASMQSIGMTTKQLRRMLMTESLSYVLRAGVIGTVVAVILGVTAVKLLVENGPIWYMTFHLTILPAILLSIIYIVLALIIPMISLRFLNRQSIVERLKTGE